MTAFEVLQIQPTNDKQVIKTAYKSLAKKYHPDFNKDPRATKVMALINKAYQTLMKAELRPTVTYYYYNTYNNYSGTSGTTAW